jgi:hypothetical protein
MPNPTTLEDVAGIPGGPILKSFLSVAADDAGRHRAQILTEAQGLKGENFSRTTAAVGTIAVDGTIYFMLTPFLAGDVVTNLHPAVTTVANGLTLAKVGIYNLAGTRLATSADLGSDWTNLGVRTNALSASVHDPRLRCVLPCGGLEGLDHDADVPPAVDGERRPARRCRLRCRGLWFSDGADRPDRVCDDRDHEHHRLLDGLELAVGIPEQPMGAAPMGPPMQGAPMQAPPMGQPPQPPMGQPGGAPAGFEAWLAENLGPILMLAAQLIQGMEKDQTDAPMGGPGNGPIPSQPHVPSRLAHSAGRGNGQIASQPRGGPSAVGQVVGRSAY